MVINHYTANGNPTLVTNDSANTAQEMYCNYSAGYVAGTAGQGWVASRKAFDALESLQQGRPSKEAMVSQFAEKAGHNRGIKVYWQEQYDVQRILQQGREHTWKRVSDFFKSVFK